MNKCWGANTQTIPWAIAFQNQASLEILFAISEMLLHTANTEWSPLRVFYFIFVAHFSEMLLHTANAGWSPLRVFYFISEAHFYEILLHSKHWVIASQVFYFISEAHFSKMLLHTANTEWSPLSESFNFSFWSTFFWDVIPHCKRWVIAFVFHLEEIHLPCSQNQDLSFNLTFIDLTLTCVWLHLQLTDPLNCKDNSLLVVLTSSALVWLQMTNTWIELASLSL